MSVHVVLLVSVVSTAGGFFGLTYWYFSVLLNVFRPGFQVALPVCCVSYAVIPLITFARFAVFSAST